MSLSSNKLKLTDGEINILRALKCEHYTKITNSVDVVYRMVMENIFINDIRGPAVDAFRRIFIAYRNWGPCRGTKEFEELAKLDDSKD